MLDVRLVVERPADARFKPARGSMLEPPRREDEIHFLGSVVVVGVAHMRCQQGGSDGEVSSVFQAPWSDDRGVGVPLRPVVAGEGATRSSRRPGQ